jgi:hypothetical protein
MRRNLVIAALVMIAAPAAAQEQAAALAPVLAAATQAPVAAPAAESEVASTRTPTLQVTREQIDARLQADRYQGREMTQRDFLYTAAAVALGVIVALLLLD